MRADWNRLKLVFDLWMVRYEGYLLSMLIPSQLRAWRVDGVSPLTSSFCNVEQMCTFPRKRVVAMHTEKKFDVFENHHPVPEIQDQDFEEAAFDLQLSKWLWRSNGANIQETDERWRMIGRFCEKFGKDEFQFVSHWVKMKSQLWSSQSLIT